MRWIEASQYVLTALAALFGFWVAISARREGPAPTEAGERLMRRLMGFSITLLLLSGFLGLLDAYLAHKSTQDGLRASLGRMDQALGSRFDIEGDAFAQLDSHTRHQLDNMIRQLCRDVVEMNKTAASAQIANCKTRLERASARRTMNARTRLT